MRLAVATSQIKQRSESCCWVVPEAFFLNRGGAVLAWVSLSSFTCGTSLVSLACLFVLLSFWCCSLQVVFERGQLFGVPILQLSCFGAVGILLVC